MPLPLLAVNTSFVTFSARGRDNKMNMRPTWKHAFKTKNDRLEVVETELEAEGIFTYAMDDSYKKWVETKDAEYIRSMMRLVIIKERATGDMHSYIMTLVPETTTSRTRK